MDTRKKTLTWAGLNQKKREIDQFDLFGRDGVYDMKYRFAMYRED